MENHQNVNKDLYSGISNMSFIITKNKKKKSRKKEVEANGAKIINERQGKVK